MTTTFSPEWDDLFFNTPDPESTRVREFGRWLRANKYKEVTLYHGTSKKVPVLEKGLLPTSAKRRRSLQSASGFVYLSVFPGSAENFGKMGYPGHEIVVYAVRLMIRHLRPDKDQLANKRHWAELAVRDCLEHSLVFGYGARVKGKVDRMYLSLVDTR